MKRISFWLALLLLPAGAAPVHAYYSYFCGVHYSPYALSYRGSGLVPGYVDYSPYAFNYRHSGLIDRCTQYTPYVLGYRNSGLVPGYGLYPFAYCEYAVYPASAVPPRARHAAPRASCAVRGFAQSPAPAPRRADGIDIIRDHLRCRGFVSLHIDRILRVDNQLVSVDFYVKDRDILIKFWNPQEVERLQTKEVYKQQAYAKYKQDWDRYAEQYRRTGGEIYVMNGSDPQTIVAALDSCPKLQPGNAPAGPPVLYAKN
ncbi:MAG: hypothetical protein MUC88_13350 [Planctomycetes bacterium]|nr:hypothetical protein [Planctomycetota bacterium]